jgi:hypothetical protein
MAAAGAAAGSAFKHAALLPASPDVQAKEVRLKWIA